ARSRNDTLRIDAASGAGVTLTVEGETLSFAPGAVTSTSVQPGGGSNTINIESTLAGVPVTVNDTTGTDPIFVCANSEFLDNIQGNVTVHGGGLTTLTVNDSLDNFAGDMYTIT